MHNRRSGRNRDFPLPLVLLLALVCGTGVGQEDSLPSTTREPGAVPIVDDEAAASPRRPGTGYLTFYLDNDLFGGADRDYTNGVRLSWISEDEPAFGFAPARRQLEHLAREDPGYRWFGALSGFDEESLARGEIALNYGLSLTQLMFTPEDPRATGQPPGQRRYAGWLALGFSVHAKDAHALNSAELLLGTTGPRSLAEDAQNLIHDLRDIDRFEGWEDQIPNEITLDLSFVQKRRVKLFERREQGFSVDGFTEWGVRLGTFQTLARAGGFFRAGFNLPADFSDPRISATAYSHKFFEDGLASGPDWSVYALFGAGGAGVAFDATLDGPLFSDFETGIEREPWVGEGFAGFGVRWRIFEFSYAHTWRTEAYREQNGGNDFGSLALRLRLRL